MDRRTALFALLTAVPFNRAALERQRRLETLPPREPGILTVPLDLWKTVRVTYQGKEIEIPVQTIFDELARP